MDAQDASLDARAAREPLEDAIELDPNILRVRLGETAATLFAEAVNLVDRCVLVVATDHENLAWVLYLFLNNKFKQN